MRASLVSVFLLLCLAALAAALAQGAEVGVQVRKPKLMVVPESMVNRSAAQQYVQMKQQAASRGMLITPSRWLITMENSARRPGRSVPSGFGT